jgi:hypothetical protein
MTYRVAPGLFIVFMASRHLASLAPHMRISMVPGGQNALLATAAVKVERQGDDAKCAG